MLLTALVALDLVGAPPHLEPLRVTDPPVVDGHLDDSAWARAPVSDHFVQMAPQPGAAPAEPTRVRVVYDDDDLYVGVECVQRGVPVDMRLTRRDREINTDWVSIDLDSRADGVSAFHFVVSSAGVLLDGIRYDDTEYSGAWDENWEAETSRSAAGWTAELRIPLRVLRFVPDRRQTWGLQVRRYTSARQESLAWAYIPPTAAGEVSLYGRLGPFDRLPRHAGIELRPFLVARARRRDPEPGLLARGTDAEGQVGLDAKWHLGQDLTLDLTLAPDFGQVEADEVVLNLGTFETFFDEKRPFFLEGLDVLATPVQLVYTRRIGAPPNWPAIRDDARHREQLVDAPEPSTIAAAGKLTGHTGRLTVGALSALTAPNLVDVQLAGGQHRTRLADPMTAFEVVRLKQELGDNAHVGLLAGATLRIEDRAYPIVSERSAPAVQRLCPSGARTGDAGDCFRDAFVAGVDARVRAGEWVAQGQVVGSLVRGGPDRSIADGTVVASGDASAGANLRIAKEGGTHWLGNVQYELYGRKLALNDLGYLQRQNLHHVFATVEYQQTEPTGPFLFADTGLELFGYWNLAGLHGPRGIQLYGLGKLKNRMFFYTEVHWRPTSYDDREFGDGTALQREGLLGLELYGETSTSAPVSFSTSAALKRLWNGYNVSADAGFVLRAIPALDLRLSPSVLFTDGEPRATGAATEDGAPVLGELRAQDVSLTLHATWTFTPRLTLQLFGQLYLATVHYHHFTADPTPTDRVPLADLRPTAAPAFDPDFQDAALNVSAVLRWEWSLGATFWLVYSRAQTASPVLDPERGPSIDVGALRDGRAVDVVLGKVSWWWG